MSTKAEAKKYLKAVKEAQGNVASAAGPLGINESTLRRALDAAARKGWVPMDWRTAVYLTKEQAQARYAMVKECGGNVAAAARNLGIRHPTLAASLDAVAAKGWVPTDWRVLHPAAGGNSNAHPEKLVSLLRRKPMSLEDVAANLGCTRGEALDRLDGLKGEGSLVVETDGLYGIKTASPMPAFMSDNIPTYYSRPDGSYFFGVTTDNHLCSKYSREEVLSELYDEAERLGVDRMFNCGNWIDGEARFNVHDLKVHGMDNQLRYLADHFPQRKGITTYAVAGDDHEGWYGQKAGVDIGRRAEQTMREHGRKDWVNLGFMESHVRLIHSVTGKEQILSVVHPGGGSSYALSYAPQKYIESLDGGEKPAVVLFGHWHKMEMANIRNVWCIQCGTTEDQSPFMRKLKLSAHVGGVFVKLQQDAVSGAIMGCQVDFRRYFNKGFAGGNRWNHGADVEMAARELNAS